MANQQQVANEVINPLTAHVEPKVTISKGKLGLAGVILAGLVGIVTTTSNLSTQWQSMVESQKYTTIQLKQVSEELKTIKKQSVATHGSVLQLQVQVKSLMPSR